ncbi:hypothetical protein EST38_g704 [Candolleomyces aberdarensis]|uniref:Alpha/beta hydrolase fold-3 domain-containing protein n=1 Tax=Candolleomyces aberdarensis TaxID=2316362 RepID=A0A4Q2DXQ2_9AGAR|nr:hypothetical protein EST38_g704 [Candolleomyces aberdarensis]
MPVNTASAAFHIAPVVLKTFAEHRKQRKAREKQGKEAPQDDILFDEAFNIVKSFIELGTNNTIESLQAFTNTRVPSLYWVAVSPVTIPLSICNEAADTLIEWFGPEELNTVVGGERWWQVRGLSGIDAEWIAEREHLDDAGEKVGNGQKLTREEQDILQMEKLESVIFYVHGGGYFWGSINTHRYQIIRLAHKLKGRAFAVNYSMTSGKLLNTHGHVLFKTCSLPVNDSTIFLFYPIADNMATDLYLIRPPPGSLHKAVDPGKIVFAGDSAGGGLCVTVMTVLRDLNLPMPAGAVLISPWVDLTHSFPSVLQNTETDIVPPHGFLAKPSVLWPLDPCPKTPRIVRTETNPPPRPGEADTLKPSPEREEADKAGTDIPGEGFAVETQEEMLEKYNSMAPYTLPSPQVAEKSASSESSSSSSEMGGRAGHNKAETQVTPAGWEAKPAKILMENDIEAPLELRCQIQLYATTEQLTHPLVSPISQGSLCNLPPLYIIAGDSEMLRDEIIYFAHRAAHPSDYPVREAVLKGARRQRENAAKFTTPTKVHLQVFDGMPHVLTVFMFTKSARYAYRSIAEFVRHVTQKPKEEIERSPFPAFEWKPRSDTSESTEPLKASKSKKRPKPKPFTKTQGGPGQESPDSEQIYEHNEQVTQETLRKLAESPEPDAHLDDDDVLPSVPIIRERIDIHGMVRPMEPREEIPALHLPPDKIGMIKEAPAMRWYRGQEEWDKRFHKAGKRVLQKREKLKDKADKLIKHALEQGLVHEAFPESLVDEPTEKHSRRPVNRRTSIGEIQEYRRWGPLDLKDERPPASAIAGRRDTHESLALLRTSIYYAAPITHKTVPRLKASDALRATFDPHDDPNAPPKQSASEQQVDRMQIAPLNGLRIWEKILGYLGRKSSTKATDGIRNTAAIIRREREDTPPKAS